MFNNVNISMYYEAELNQIKFPKIREAIELILNRAPEYYMTVDAASKPRYSRGKDGEIVKLRDHTKEVARYVLLFLTHPTIRGQFTDIQRDYMLGAALVHDLAKRGLDKNPTRYNVFEHPILIIKLVPDIYHMDKQMQEHISSIINIAVAHNGPWRTNGRSDIVLPEMTNNMQFYVHLADWLASRGVTWINSADEVIDEFVYKL